VRILKKVLVYLILLMTVVVSKDLLAQDYIDRYVMVETAFNDLALDGTSSADTSSAIPLTGPNLGYGYYSIWVKADENTGTADFTLTYRLSFDGGTTWAYESGTGATTTIVSNFTGTSWKAYLLEPMPATHIQIIATAESGNGADIDIYTKLLRHPL